MPLNSRIPTEMFDLWPGHWAVFFDSTQEYRWVSVMNKLVSPLPSPPQKKKIGFPKSLYGANLIQNLLFLLNGCQNGARVKPSRWIN